MGSRRVLSFPYKALDAFVTAFKTATWIGSLPFNGHLCLPSEDFFASSEMNHSLFEYNTSSLAIQSASVHCCTPLLADLERILEATNVSLMYANPPDPTVTVP